MQESHGKREIRLSVKIISFSNLPMLNDRLHSQSLYVNYCEPVDPNRNGMEGLLHLTGMQFRGLIRRSLKKYIGTTSFQAKADPLSGLAFLSNAV